MDYNTFNTVEDYRLRGFNRFMYARNLVEDKGHAYAEDYLNQFSKDERLVIAMIGLSIAKVGEKKTRELVTAGIDFPENM